MEHNPVSGEMFVFSLPPAEDSDFARAYERIVGEVTRTAFWLRVQCAIVHGVSVFDTEATITPDPERPNVVTVTARPRAGVIDRNA